MTQYWRNIQRYWGNVTGDDLQAGHKAYPAYHEMMRRVAVHYDVDQTLVTEAFAALSPNNDYKGNLRSLISVMEGHKHGAADVTVSTYNACARRAMQYISREVDFLSTVKGPKITAFRNCIVDPNRCEDFVLDGHMIAVALGKKLTMEEANFELRKHKYDVLANSYIRFAHRKALRVPVVQATLWYCRKRVEGIKFTTQRDFWRDDARLLYPLAEIPAYR